MGKSPDSVMCAGSRKSPDSVMCAGSRMVVRRKEANQATVVACTLLPYEPEFELGATLAEAAVPVRLNHRFCTEFCVLGGASCSGSGLREVEALPG